jgi:hypothetical protein
MRATSNSLSEDDFTFVYNEAEQGVKDCSRRVSCPRGSRSVFAGAEGKTEWTLEVFDSLCPKCQLLRGLSQPERRKYARTTAYRAWCKERTANHQNLLLEEIRTQTTDNESGSWEDWVLVDASAVPEDIIVREAMLAILSEDERRSVLQRLEGRTVKERVAINGTSPSIERTRDERVQIKLKEQLAQ